MPGRTPPVFGPSEVDQTPNSVSLSAVPLGNYWSNFFANGANAPARSGIGLDTTNADQARTWQNQMMQDLQRQAAGDPNSRAQQSLSQGYGAARAGQSALGSGLRGTGGGAGVRAGMMGAGNVQRGYAGDQQMLMTQEQQSAQALLAQQLAQQRGQDAGQAGMMANNALGNQSLENAMRQFYTQGGIQGDLGSMQTQADRVRASLGFDLEGQDAQRDLNNRITQAGATGISAAAHPWGAGGGGGGSGVGGGTNRLLPYGEESIVPSWDK